MLDWLRAATAIALTWSVVALGWQVVSARGGGRALRGRANGSPLRGVIYNFTVAMTPSHKESVRKYPLEFGIGIVLHLGTALAILDVLLIVFGPTWAEAVEPFFLPVLIAGALAGIALIVRRTRSSILRAMSAADDFVAIVAVIALLVLGSLHAVGLVGPVVLLAFATLLFLYVPLGKLRHAAFFFAVRADVGRRMGHRGSYPVAPQERIHAG